MRSLNLWNNLSKTTQLIDGGIRIQTYFNFTLLTTLHSLPLAHCPLTGWKLDFTMKLRSISQQWLKYVIQIFHHLISSSFIIYIITSEKITALATFKESTLHTEFEQDQYFLRQSLTECSGFHLFFLIISSSYSGFRFCNKNSSEPFWCLLHYFSMSSNVLNIECT